MLDGVKVDPIEDLIVPCKFNGEMGRRMCSE